MNEVLGNAVTTIDNYHDYIDSERRIKSVAVNAKYQGAMSQNCSPGNSQHATLATEITT
jgi:hypothetical protein